MKCAIAAILLILCCCATNSFGAAASAAFTLETGVPEGFANLTEPQQLVADLYYGNKQVGASMVEVGQHTLRFLEPDAVFKMLPTTLDPEAVYALLQQSFPRNSHRVCYSRQQRNCGFITPEAFGLIYDDSRYRIDLFFAPDLLPQKAAIDDPYLPDASSRFSFVQNLTGTWSGVESGDGQNSQSASLFGQSILSFGESGLHSQWSTTDSGDSQISQLHWTRDYRGRAYSAGLIQPLGGFSSFVPSPHLYGVEYRSSYNSRTDNRYNQGAPLEINMPVRGRVEIHRDGRLIHSELLEAGNQLLDTSSLPGGAYEVEIKSFDESGRPMAQYTEFFAKDSLLPPPGEWRWAVQAGQPARLIREELLPERHDNYFLQAGAARRLFDDTGLFANIAATDSEYALELGGRWISRYLELSPSVIRTGDGRSGHRLFASLNTPLFNLSASEVRLENDTQPSEYGEFSLLGRGFRQRSANLSSTLFGGRLSLRYSQRDRNVFFESPEFTLDTEFSSANSLTTLEYRRDFFRNRYWHGEMTVSHSDADGEQLTSATLNFRFRGKHWDHNASVRTDTGREDGQNTRLGFRSGWRDADLWASDIDQQISGEATADEYYLGSYTRIAGHRGYLSSTLDYRNSSADDQSSLNYLGSFSTNLMTTDEAFAWGGERSLTSGVLVDIAGSEDEDFEILVNGVRRGYAKGGDRSLINLPAFQSYDIQLRPLSAGFYDYREVQESVTLYPGNVTSTRYEIEPVILVLGRILRGEHPVPGAKISIGEYSAVTDEFGIFQMEMHAAPQTLRAPAVRWSNCLVDIAEQASGENWLNLGDIDLAAARCERNTLAHSAN